MTTTPEATSSSTAISTPPPSPIQYSGTTTPETPEMATDALSSLGSLEIALLAAAIGALIAGGFVYNQTHQMRKLDAANKARKLRAVRAVLPLSLSNLSEWSADCIHELLQIYHRVDGGGAAVPLQALEVVPSLPSEVLPQLEQFAEFGNEGAAKSVANLLGNIQVFTARMRSRGGRHRTNCSPSAPMAQI